MSKRVGYPILFFGLFLVFNVGSRTFLYAFSRVSASEIQTYTFLAILEFFFTLVIPFIILKESQNRKYVIYAAYFMFLQALVHMGEALYLINELHFLPENTFMIIDLLVLGGIIYMGKLRIRDDADDIRIGRSIIIYGVVVLTYLLIIPNSLDRTLFNYMYYMLNPFVLIVFIMQGLVLDDLIIDNEMEKDRRRARL
jgi:hypothetical protein